MPTLVGYSAQGFGKFGFYEIFKDVYAAAAGENAAKYKTVGWAVSSACAELIADCFLCPWEAVSNTLNSIFSFSMTCQLHEYNPLSNNTTMNVGVQKTFVIRMDYQKQLDI